MFLFVLFYILFVVFILNVNKVIDYYKSTLFRVITVSIILNLIHLNYISYKFIKISLNLMIIKARNIMFIEDIKLCDFYATKI
jgi:hypothetical protein